MGDEMIIQTTDGTYKWLCDARGCNNELPLNIESDDYAAWDRIHASYDDLLQYLWDQGYRSHRDREAFCIPCMQRIYPEWERLRQHELAEIAARQREIETRRQRKIGTRHAARYARTGFTEERFQFATTLQGGRCAVCRVVLASLPSQFVHADHCHVTGTSRGVLCRDCNLAAGWLHDDPSRCLALAHYLENFPLDLI